VGSEAATRGLTRPLVARASFAVGFLSIAVVGFDRGGFAQSAWGWILIAGSCAIGLARTSGISLKLGVLAWVSLASLAGLAAWMFVSGAWAIGGSASGSETERALVYVVALGAFLAVVRASSVRALLLGVLGAIVALAVYALVDRVVGGVWTDKFEGPLLNAPLGYANALGILCALGVVIAVGLFVEERRIELVGAAAVLATALVLTSSRGAAVALACGLATLTILRRAHRPGRLPIVCAVAAMVVALTASWAAGLGERSAYWRVALHDAREHPTLGSGAGTFDDYWFAHRPDPTNAQDAHSLYLETLAELGPIAAILLVFALVPPLLAAGRARQDAAVATAAAAYVALLVHAGLDWDWEMPATMLAGLACAAALLRAD
jgi:O-antigen ligase